MSVRTNVDVWSGTGYYNVYVFFNMGAWHRTSTLLTATTVLLKDYDTNKTSEEVHIAK